MHAKKNMLALACITTALTSCANLGQLGQTPQSQLTCHSVWALDQCMEQAQVKGLTHISFTAMNDRAQYEDIGIVDAWAKVQQINQNLIAQGVYPPEVQHVDRDIAALMPEAQEILNTGDWAKYPAWKIKFEALVSQSAKITAPVNRQMFDEVQQKAAAGREWIYEHPNNAPLGGLHTNQSNNNGGNQMCEEIRSSESGTIYTLVPCSH